MKKPNVLILSGYGLNTESETKFAFEKARAVADIIHINDVIENPKILSLYQIMVFPGGFAYGDDTGSGNAYASKLKNHLWSEIDHFAHTDHLIIGICNGFQILVSLGLVPALGGKYGEKQVALLANESTRYTVRWCDVEVINDSPWLAGIKTLPVPIAHGEGRFYADPKTLGEMKKKNLIALRYCEGEMYDFRHLPVNPTGTLENIAGITDESGRLFGMMPHPERAILFTQLPDFPNRKEHMMREGKPIPEEGPGMQIFRNAVHYFS